MEPNDMTTGSKYLLITKVSTEQYTRRHVMTYLGVDAYGARVFNARPAAGSQSLRDEQILAISLAGPDDEHFANERGGTLPKLAGEQGGS